MFKINFVPLPSGICKMHLRVTYFNGNCALLSKYQITNSNILIKLSLYLPCHFRTASFMVIYTASASVNRIIIDPNIGITIDTVSELNPTPVESAANRKYTYTQYRVIYACSV